MPTSNADYWRKREEKQREKNIKDEKEYEKRIKALYRQELNAIEDRIYAFYTRYAGKEGITMAEAKRRVSKMDVQEFAEMAAKYVKEKDFSDRANEELRLYNLTMRVNYQQLLMYQIALESCATADELDQFMQDKLERRTLDEIKRQAGILGESLLDQADMVHSIVNASFHNATFSDRIWANQAMLRSNLSNILTNALIQGRNPRDYIKDIRKIFDVSRGQAERLLRTELARVQSEAQLKSYEKAEFDEYIFHALGDACPVCAVLDGEHFKVKDAEPGINISPMHPNCRCSTGPYMDTEDFDEWLAGIDEHGLTFEEWKSKYLEHDETTFVSEKNYLGDDMSELRAVNRSLVNTKAYHDKFDKVQIGKKARESAYQTAMKMLEHRDGTDCEDIAAINLRTGEIIAFNTSATKPGKSGFTEDEYRRIVDSKAEILIVHNHPNSSRLSYKDLKTMFQFDFVKMEMAVCHNGDINLAYDPDRNFDIESYYQRAYNDFKEIYGKKQSELFATDKLYDSETFKYERR